MDGGDACAGVTAEIRVVISVSPATRMKSLRKRMAARIAPFLRPSIKQENVLPTLGVSSTCLILRRCAKHLSGLAACLITRVAIMAVLIGIAAEDKALFTLFGQRVNMRVSLHILAGLALLIGLTFCSLLTSAEANGRYFENSIPHPQLKPDPVRAKKLIVIDPGHGGRDPGTIGRKGTYEKTITTSAANELSALLKATGRYDVILTRRGDKYVEHDNRIRIARERQADLFISIHADATSNSTVRGASIYTLADRAKGRSKRIVNNQNWIMDVDLSAQSDPVGDILVDLAQRSTETRSEAFADILLENLKDKTRLVNNTHRRAGYYVLLAPDVPAVLFELGYMSNPSDEALLRTKSHRRKLMQAVRESVDQYFAEAEQT